MSHRPDSPALALANLILYDDRSSELVIVTGPSGAGKTHTCQELTEILGENSVKVGGLISPPIFDGNRKIAIDLVSILSGERRRLAELQEDSSFPPDDKDNQAFVDFGRWRFSTETFTWGNSILQDLPDCGCLLIDEFGPLELQESRGLQFGLSLLDQRPRVMIVAVVREQLIPSAKDRWPWAVIMPLPYTGGDIGQSGAAL